MTQQCGTAGWWKGVDEITYGDEIMADVTDPIQKSWLDGIIFGDDNVMHNNEVDETFGDIKIIEIVEDE